jgi:hypothetical protein
MRWISLFPKVKNAAPYLVPIKSYSKNSHPPFFEMGSSYMYSIKKPRLVWIAPSCSRAQRRDNTFQAIADYLTQYMTQHASWTRNV